MKRNKKRHIGLLIFLVLLAVGSITVFASRGAIADGIKGKAAKEIAKKLFETQMGSDITVGGQKVDVSEIIDNMDEEDVQRVTDIAEKYVSEESIGDYIEMAQQGDISQIKEYAQETLSDEDKEELKDLYEKYKDQIPVN